MIDTLDVASPLGPLLLAAKDGALVGLWLEGQKYFGGVYAGEERQTGGQEPILEQTKVWLERYFAGQRPAISELVLAPAGSLFQQTVWAILTEIPYGELTTYGAIAKEAARRLAMRFKETECCLLSAESFLTSMTMRSLSRGMVR